jgi:hypothetical protein
MTERAFLRLEKRLAGSGILRGRQRRQNEEKPQSGGYNANHAASFERAARASHGRDAANAVPALREQQRIAITDRRLD